MEKEECKYYKRTNQYGEFCTNKANGEISCRGKNRNRQDKRCLAKFCPLKNGI